MPAGQIIYLLDESLRLCREQCRVILAPHPPTLPDCFPLSNLARLTNNSSGAGRKTAARLLCLVRNMRLHSGFG